MAMNYMLEQRDHVNKMEGFNELSQELLTVY